MSSLVAPRPPGWLREEEDDRQGSLFSGDAFRPPARRRHAPAAPAPREHAPGERAAPAEELFAPPHDEVAAPPEDVAAPAPPFAEVAAPEDVAAPAPPFDEATAPPEDVAPTREFLVPEEDTSEFRVSRGAGSPLAGPTLDDAVSRAWEGLVAGVPAACPVCHGEIEPVLGGGARGYCASCHVTLD
jgi:hypothetical protein